MAETYTGRIDTLEIGLTAAVGAHADITNVVLFNWERNHDVRPRLYANLKYPTTYQQPHSWIVGNFSLLSDHHPAIYATDVQAAAGNQYAMAENADSNVIDYFQIFYKDSTGAAITTRFYNAIIYRYTKELLNYDDSVWIYYFMASYVDMTVTPPVPVVADLVSSDADSKSIYIHNGISSTITTSFSFCVPTVGTYFDGAGGIAVNALGNLVSYIDFSSTIYIHSGITSTVTTSFSVHQAAGGGMVIDGTGNLIRIGRDHSSVYIHSGITSTITTSFSTPYAYPATGYPLGLTLDLSGNLITADLIKRSVYIHSGVTSTITTSFSTPGTSPTDITVDASGNLVSLDVGKKSVYIHAGITSTITTSFSSPSTSPQGAVIV